MKESAENEAWNRGIKMKEKKGVLGGKRRQTASSISVIKAAPDAEGGRTNSGGVEIRERQELCE